VAHNAPATDTAKKERLKLTPIVVILRLRLGLLKKANILFYILFLAGGNNDKAGVQSQTGYYYFLILLTKEFLLQIMQLGKTPLPGNIFFTFLWNFYAFFI
jgi:hypothetical protein